MKLQPPPEGLGSGYILVPRATWQLCDPTVDQKEIEGSGYEDGRVRVA